MGMWCMQNLHRGLCETAGPLSWDEIVRQAEAAEPFRSLVNLEEPVFVSDADPAETIRAYCGKTGQPVPAALGEIARCVYESMALQYRQTLAQLRELSGREFTKLRIVGGGGKNGFLNQMIADAARMRVEAGPYESASVGGNVMTNAGGMRAVKYGVTRDYVRELKVVLPDGRMVALGGKTAKNSSGYSLMQLMIGSEGTLGVVVEATLRLIPLPRFFRSLLVPFPDNRLCMEAMTQLLAQRIMPTAVEFMQGAVIELSQEYLGRPFPDHSAQVYLLLRFDGRTLEAFHPFNDGHLAVHLDLRAHPAQLVDILKAVVHTLLLQFLRGCIRLQMLDLCPDSRPQIRKDGSAHPVLGYTMPAEIVLVKGNSGSGKGIVSRFQTALRPGSIRADVLYSPLFQINLRMLQRIRGSCRVFAYQICSHLPRRCYTLPGYLGQFFLLRFYQPGFKGLPGFPVCYVGRRTYFPCNIIMAQDVFCRDSIFLHLLPHQFLGGLFCGWLKVPVRI